MRRQSYLIALALLSVAATTQARRNVREDPFAYEELEEERQKEKEEAEEEESSKQAFGSSGDFAISFERLVGYAHTAWVEKIPNAADLKGNVDHVHGFITPGGDPISFSAPRVGFDFFVSRGISLGGAFGYGQTSGDDPVRVITLSPRFGYAVMFGDVVGLWPRIGPTYQLTFTDPVNTWLLAGSLEVPLMLVAGKNVTFHLGPRLDWAFLGQYAPDKAASEGTANASGKTRDLTAMEYGFSAGATVFF